MYSTQLFRGYRPCQRQLVRPGPKASTWLALQVVVIA